MDHEAKNEFDDLVNRFNKAEDYSESEQEEEQKVQKLSKKNFNILKKNPPCLQHGDVVLTDLEEDGEAFSSEWAQPNLEKLDACVKHYIENHSVQYEAHEEGFLEEEKELKDQIEALEDD